MPRIGLLSDTHGHLDDRILHHLEDCDEIWHAGDIGSLDITKKLKSFAPIRAVYGNIDGDQIRKEFKFKNLDNLKKGPYFEEVNKQNTVSICIRQNRFIEGRGQNTYLNKKKSWKFTLEQIDYINKSADYIKSKISNPIFLLWSNAFSNIQKDKFNFTYKEIKINDDKIVADKRIQSLYLLTQCKHYIVTTSTFNWWGCGRSENTDKIVFRPSDNLFSEFRTNNEDFWPLNWIEIDEKSYFRALRWFQTKLFHSFIKINFTF